MIIDKNNEYFTQAVKLYKDTFKDSDEFIKVVMESVICASVDIENNIVVSCAFAREKQIRKEKDIITFPFMFGIATDKKYRNKGRASKVINEMFNYLKQSYNFTMLCPANSGLYEFYKKFGFEKLCFFKYEKVGGVIGEIKEGNLDDSKLIADLFNNANLAYREVLYRNIDATKLKLQEILSDSGKIYIVYKNGKAIGYMLYDDFILESIGVEYREGTKYTLVKDSNIEEKTNNCPGVVIKKFKNENMKHLRFYEMW